MPDKKKIGVLGLGNLLLGDEGFGVHFINYLTDHYQVPDHVSVLDGGTAGIMMGPFIESNDILYVIDTVAAEAEPGSIRIYSDADIKTRKGHGRMSPHQVGLFDILDMCRVRETIPEQITMIAIVPKEIHMSIELSPAVQEKLPEVMKILLDSLAGHDTVFEPKSPLSCA